VRWGEGRFAYHQGVAKSANNVIGCPACGYNLIASPARGRCPECGKQYRDLKPGMAMAFWTNRRFALLLVLAPVCCALASYLLMVLIERGIIATNPGISGITTGSGLLLGIGFSIYWQAPLALLSGAASLFRLRRGAAILAYCFGALAHTLITLWGIWAVCSTNDAQGAIGLIFIPFYSGIAGWFVAGFALCLCLLGRVVLRRRSRCGVEPQHDSRV